MKFWRVIGLLTLTGMLAGAVMASAATLSIGGTNNLGQGSADINSPNVEVTDVSWDVDPAGSKIREIIIRFEKTGIPDVTLEDIIVIIEDGSGGPLYTKTNLGIDLTVNGVGANHPIVIPGPQRPFAAEVGGVEVVVTEAVP